MEFFNKHLKPITEVKYLNAENVRRYRAIIRIFYEKYNQLNRTLYKDEIVKIMRESEQFKDYSSDMCEQDINKLMEWGNIIGIQDTAKATTPEEFKNKKYIYQITEKAITIEKLVSEDLEKIVFQEAELDPSLMERLRDSLEELDKKEINKVTDINSLWSNIISDFERLNNNYKSYIMKLNSFKFEELLNTTQFIIYKDNLIDYLRNFIKGLQKYGLSIVKILKDIDKEKIEEIFRKISLEKKKIMILTPDITEENIFEDLTGKWEAVLLWFLGNENRKSEMEMLYDRTNEIIRKIVRIALHISESSRQISSRKEECLKIASLFSNCNSINEAHKLSAMIFGAFNTKHFKGEIRGEVTDKNIGAFETEPIELEIKPRTRKYREKRQSIAIIDKTHRKAEIIREKQRELEKEKQEILELVKSEMIKISDLDNISENVRKTLLRWIVRGIESPGNKEFEIVENIKYRVFPIRKNEDNSSYKILMNDKNQIRLNCIDGIFYMPDIIIKIVGES
ncbi:TIGR02677 family protein [Haliovirga abyssi]|uniref:TIGR02677 family protein n=1 Tax=Haliovirga abyssi TaxID=2996794 RepID=A0AAU9DKM9_9FUSO|nr:TIGR02677 family protein [Haliovirga abyssi]BDU51479.1 TIGR02677 family protein [Haliovirga abyssi]